jgi:hypothetical protein
LSPRDHEHESFPARRHGPSRHILSRRNDVVVLNGNVVATPLKLCGYPRHIQLRIVTWHGK